MVRILGASWYLLGFASIITVAMHDHLLVGLIRLRFFNSLLFCHRKEKVKVWDSQLKVVLPKFNTVRYNWHLDLAYDLCKTKIHTGFRIFQLQLRTITVHVVRSEYINLA
jgi:hypothetical protein